MPDAPNAPVQQSETARDAGIRTWQPMTPESGRSAHLDGLRGVAILLVVAAHLTNKLPRFPGGEFLGSVGGLGVYVFFALSGYLITGILTREHQRDGRISLKNFYVRRTLRILPAFYAAFLALVALAALTTTVDISQGQALFAGLFMANYATFPIGWWLVHSWSLAVEEQFYLLWPAALVFLKPKNALRFSVVVVVLEPVIRIATWVAVPAERDNIGLMLPTHADALLVGAALALLAAQHPGVVERLVIVIGKYHLAWIAAVFLPVDQYLFNELGGPYELPVGWTLESVAIIVIIAAAESAGKMRVFLSWRPLAAVGLISYSLYLWQEVFMSDSWKNGLMADPGLCVVFAFAAAVVSRRVIEIPCIRLARRYRPAPAVPSRAS